MVGPICTYYPSISASDVHQSSRSGPQHPENVLHLSRGGWNKREADSSEGRGNKRSGHRVKSDQRPSNNPGDDQPESTSSPSPLADSSATLSSVQNQFMLWHDATSPKLKVS